MRTIALTRQRKAFADEYIKTLKIKDSYLKAYKSCKSVDSAYSAGSRLLKDPEVKPYNELDNILTVKAALDAGLSRTYAYGKLRDIDDIQEELDRQEQEKDPYADALSLALGGADEER